MGGATAHPTGATLASGDPPVSLNAMGRFESYHSPVAVLILGLVGASWLVPALAGAAAVCEQGNGMRSAPPHRRGSTSPAVCLLRGVAFYQA